MKSILVAFAVLLSTTCPLWAADIDQSTPYADAQHDWSGPYLGAHFGYGQVDVDGSYLDGDVQSGLEVSDPFGGAQAGFNWQIGSLVLGLEGDLGLAEWDGDQGPNAQNQFVSADLDWLATLRARAGFAFDNLLIFASAGGAWANGEFTGEEDITLPVIDKADAKFDDFGLAAGGGVEWAFSEAWSWKLEGLWINFDERLNITNLTTNSDPSDTAKFEDAWLVWVGLNLHF